MADSPSPPEADAELLSFYKAPEPVQRASPPAPAPPRELSKTRLYVGNLHPTVNEYVLLQVFSKYGKVSKLDFLFHKAGPHKGKPRGFAFIEFSAKEDAMNALVNAHDKPVRGRKLVVTFASQAPENESYSYVAGSSRHGNARRHEPQRPTTLSLLKSGPSSAKTGAKIAALEAKLREMEKDEQRPASTLPVHGSLPLKPPPSVLETRDAEATTRNPRGFREASRPSSSSSSTVQTPVGIFASGSGSKLGRKPTLEELMRSKTAGASGQSRGIFG